MTPIELSATEAARQLREGELSAEDMVKACLERIDEIVISCTCGGATPLR